MSLPSRRNAIGVRSTISTWIVFGSDAAHARLLDPGNRFELPAPLVKRNTQHAAAAVGGKNLEHARARNVVISR